MSENSSSNKRIAKNTLFLYLRLLLVLVVSLYTSRVVLNVLGVSDYGVYNVVAGFVTLFGFLNATLSASMQRFYNYEEGQRGNVGLMDVYSSGFWIHVFLAVCVFLVLETFGIWYINHVMVLDSDRLEAANYLFQFSTFSMLFLILQIPYLSVVLSKEKMDYYALISIVDIIFRLLIVLALPHILYDKLVIYGLFLLIISIIDFVCYFVYVRRNFSFLKISCRLNKTIFKEMLSFSGWNLIGTFAFLLKGQGLNLLLNGFFNTAVNAARGVAFQINNAISGFTNNAAMAFKPQIVQSYSIGETSRTRMLMFVESKICYALILLLIVPVILEIDYILVLWLGDAVPPFTNIFAVLVLIDLLLSTLNAPLTQVVFATGEIKKYQILSSIINLMLIPACYLFLFQGYNASVVFIITIVFTLINQIACLITLHEVFYFSYVDYIRQILFPCSLITILLPIIPYLVHIYMNESFLRLIVTGVLVIVSSIPLTYIILLNNWEKEMMKSLFTKVINKIK